MAQYSDSEFKHGMPVVCSNGGQFGSVDRVEGDQLKLRKDESGQHHYIPKAWVTSVDEQVHVDRPGQQAMQEWTTEAPEGSITR